MRTVLALVRVAASAAAGMWSGMKDGIASRLPSLVGATIEPGNTLAAAPPGDGARGR